MVLIYELTKDLCGRAATQLCQDLLGIKSGISICHERIINGKSLVGILSANLKVKDTIAIHFDYDEDTDKLRTIFDEVGREVSES